MEGGRFACLENPFLNWYNPQFRTVFIHWKMNLIGPARLLSGGVVTSAHMNKAFLVVPFVALAVLGAGCERGTNPPSSDAGRGTAVPSVASAPCRHPYFPLAEGYQITYQNTFPGGTPTSYTMSVVSVNGNEARTAVQFASGTRSEQTYRCADGGVAATSYVDLAAGASGRRLTAETRSSSGQLVPADLHVGSDWHTEFKIAMNLGAAFPSGAVPQNNDVTVSAHRIAVAEENVTVPAGTFQAIKVRSETTFDFGPSVSDIPGLPTTSGLVGYEWWVEGKGMVKVMVGEGNDAIVSVATDIRTP